MGFGCLSINGIELHPKDLNIKRHRITEALSSKLNKNFNTFVNEYRINHLITHVNQEDLKNKTILGIAMDYGFNTKSTFNSVFKKITGKTPKVYFMEK